MAEISNINEKTLSINIDLPDEFSKASSDDEIDIGRKLDKANVLLRSGFDNLNTDLNRGFDNINKDLNRGFDNLSLIMSEHNSRMDEHNIQMDEHNKRLEAMQQDHHIGQQEHNKRLEAIIEKLANKGSF